MKAAAEKEEDQGVNGHSLLLIDHEREHACIDGLLVSNSPVCFLPAYLIL